MTFPQFSLLLEGIGPMLYPRLRPALEANWANVGKEQVEKILRADRLARSGAESPSPTPEEKDRAEAFRIVHAFYTGEQLAAPEKPAVQALPGLPPETERAIVAFAEAGNFPSDVWARDVVGLWLELKVTAQ